MVKKLPLSSALKICYNMMIFAVYYMVVKKKYKYFRSEI